MSQCRGCGRKWTGQAECHCTACHESFTSETIFTKHQVSDRKHGFRCLTPKQMSAARTPESEKPIFTTAERKHGMVWTSWSPDERFV